MNHSLLPLVIALATAACAAASTGAAPPPATPLTASAVVRYQVADVERAIAFYTERLGFTLEQHAGAAFASVVRGNLRLLLGGPTSSGARPMPDGTRQGPGGWNRIVLYVDDLDREVASLAKANVRFRDHVEVGPGGRQILIDDPDGNPVELHEGTAK